MARRMYIGCVVVAAAAPLYLAPGAPGALVGLLAAPLAWPPITTVARPDATGRDLVGALVGTARFQFVLAALLAVGLWSWLSGCRCGCPWAW